MGVIWAVSSLSPTSLVDIDLPLSDKLLHFVEYAILGLLVAHAVARTWPLHPTSRLLALAVLITVAWGVLDELHQAFVPARDADVLDLVADAVGAVVGVAVRMSGRLVRPASSAESTDR